MRFPDKVAVVIGGAAGMGRAAALGFAAEGATVGVNDIDEAALHRDAASPPASDEFDQRDTMLAHVFLFLSVEAAYTGTGDVTARLDGYRELIDRLVAQGPPVPADAGR